jgi:hypothetical protein
LKLEPDGNDNGAYYLKEVKAALKRTLALAPKGWSEKLDNCSNIGT